MKLSGIVNDSIVDGDGIRMTVFTQGCPHHCKGCHNPETWTFEGGKEVSVAQILDIYKKNPLLDGITLSGGEPLVPERYEEVLELVKGVKALGGNVWCYTGFLYEDLRAMKNKTLDEVLKNINVLVDGPFILEKRNLSIKYRGSSNQRLLYLKDGEIISVL